MMTTLVQLSDTHIVAPGRLLGDRVDTASALARAVEAVLRLPQPPDAVLVSGDLVDSGAAVEYRHLRELLAPLPMPLFLMPGNHDERGALRAAFPEHAYLGRDGPVDYAVVIGGLRLVALDSVVPRAPHGALDPAQLDWLDATLGAAPRQPTVVAVHHPPFATGIVFMDTIGLRDEDGTLAALLQRHPQVERLVCGHVHRSVQARYGGTLALTAPSTAHQIHLDLSPHAPEAYTFEPPGLLVHAWAPGRPLATHLVPTLPFDGPYPYA